MSQSMKRSQVILQPTDKIYLKSNGNGDGHHYCDR